VSRPFDGGAFTVRVLVTGAGALLGQGIIRSLKISKLNPHIIAVDPSPLSAGLYWADKSYLVPLAKEPDYLNRLRELIASESPDVVIPGTDVELAILAGARDSLEKDFKTRVLVSSSSVISIADDKWLTAQFFKDRGFGYVPSCLPGDEGELIKDFGFPLIIKPRIGARSVGFAVVNSRKELDQAIARDSGLVIQKKVGGPDEEYTAGTLVFGGVCHASIVMRRDLRDGNTYRAYVDRYPKLNAMVRKAAVALNAHGPANFQFMVEDGELKIFEINARFSGTTPLRTIVGFNEVEMAVRFICENRPIKQPDIEPCVILRNWSETVVKSADMLKLGEC
jgi:carbamoyl-phosphate synthase large subunit